MTSLKFRGYIILTGFCLATLLEEDNQRREFGQNVNIFGLKRIDHHCIGHASLLNIIFGISKILASLLTTFWTPNTPANLVDERKKNLVVEAEENKSKARIQVPESVNFHFTR